MIEILHRVGGNSTNANAGGSSGIQTPIGNMASRIALVKAGSGKKRSGSGTKSMLMDIHKVAGDETVVRLLFIYGKFPRIIFRHFFSEDI